MYCFPRRFIDIDINDEKHMRMFNEALEIYNRIVALSSKFEVLIRDNKKKVCEYLLDDSLKYYHRYYEILFNRLDHVNESEDESFRIYQGIRDEYQKIMANLEYYKVNINGDDVLIDNINYNKYIDNEDGQIRKSVSDAYTRSYRDHEEEIFALYINKLKNDIENSQNKKYASLKQMKLEEIELPDMLIDKTVESINKHLPLMHEYVALKHELSGLEEFHLYDSSYHTYESNYKDIPYEEAFSLVRDSLAFLGDEYLSYVDTLYTGGSIDLLPKKGKRTTSYTSITYAGIPYICLNYKGGIDDIRTIAHEIGHAVHLLLAKNNNNFEYFEFSLFITEVVAKVNERLFYRYFLEKMKNQQDKRAVLSSYIASLGNSLFNQIMFTEFEDNIVNKLINNEDITVRDANELYENLLKKYNGPSLSITSNDGSGWLRINHYLLQEPYYLYQYSIGTALANIIYMRLINDANFISRYREFLKVGNTLNIVDSLKLLDISLDDENVFNSSFELMDNLMKEYKELSKKA